MIAQPQLDYRVVTKLTLADDTQFLLIVAYASNRKLARIWGSAVWIHVIILRVVDLIHHTKSVTVQAEVSAAIENKVLTWAQKGTETEFSR